MKRIKLIALSFLVFSLLQAQLKVAGIFGNNAVIQQEIAAPIWGNTKSGATVLVYFAGIMSETRADNQGNWMLRMTPLKADGKFYDLIVKSEDEKIVFKNIEIGEVWFASGQSNMEFKIGGGVFNMDEEIMDSNYPNIRFKTIDLITSSLPLNDIPQKDWQICSPENIKSFSAVAYFFAKNLHLDKKVPVGIILAARGATNIETWMSRDRLLTHPDFTEPISKMDTDTAQWNEKVRKSMQASNERENIANHSLTGINMKVQTLKYDDSSWAKTDYPISVAKMGYSGFWGLIWIRKTFEIPAKSNKKEWKLYLPINDENDRVYLNGKEIAQNVTKLKNKIITLPVGSLKQGENLVAIRMYVNWGSAEIGRNASKCYLKSNDKEQIELAGSWTHNNKIEPPVAQWLDFYNTSTVNFNGMVNPVIPYGIRGFLWYQGENNSSRFKQYAELQSLLIDDWRVRWGFGYLPFLYVQLANYKSRSSIPKTTDDWASFRDAQTTTLVKSQNTGMACTIDIGDETDIHPKNKQDVGKRLYILAKAKAYGSTENYSGPLFKLAKIEGNNIRISFDFSKNGLYTKENLPVKGFAIADTNGKWFWAEAKIDGQDIIVSSKDVTKPTKVQYAWQTNPDCNLYNTEGLPIIPFNSTLNQ